MKSPFAIPRARVHLIAMASCTAVIVAVSVGQAGGASYRGARLGSSSGPGVGLSFAAIAFPKVYCNAGTNGFCSGRITIRRKGKILGTAPLSIRSGDEPSIEVPLKPANRQEILAGGKLIKVTITTHDGSDPVQRHTYEALTTMHA